MPTAAPPKADFIGQPRNGVVPLYVQFTDKSEGIITSWEWDFGDGAKSSKQNALHTYQSKGQYTVSLKVTGPGGTDTAIKQGYITVGSPN